MHLVNALSKVTYIEGIFLFSLAIFSSDCKPKLVKNGRKAFLSFLLSLFLSRYLLIYHLVMDDCLAAFNFELNFFYI